MALRRDVAEATQTSDRRGPPRYTHDIMTHSSKPPGPAPQSTKRTPPIAQSSALAAERWLSEHGDLLWRFASARTGSFDAAEEIVQETLLAAIQSAQAFAGSSSERTWLLGIAAHKTADHFRQKRRRERADGAAQQESDPESADAVFDRRGLWSLQPAAWGLRPDAAAERAELLAALRNCMDELTPELASAVWLRDLLGMPSEEVCKALDLSPTNLWTRTHRARSALRRCVELAAGVKTERGQ